MYLDIHTHAFHPKIADKVLAQLHGHYGIPPVGTGRMDDLLSRAQNAGLDKIVVHNAATDPSQVVPANNWAISLMADHPEVIAFGSMHPGFERMEEELDRLEKAGVPGLKLHPDFQGFRMDDQGMHDIIEAAGKRFVFMFHVGDVLPPDENPSCPRKLAALRRAHPGPAMIAAHMGGYLHWEYAIEHLAGLDLFWDCSSSQRFMDDDLMNRLFDSHPADRIQFGSDYPLFDPGDELEAFKRRLNLSDERLETLLSCGSVLFPESNR